MIILTKFQSLFEDKFYLVNILDTLTISSIRESDEPFDTFDDFIKNWEKQQ